MSVKPTFNSENLYFVTTTAINHLHLFKRDVIKRIILDSFHYFRAMGRIKLFIFVIMPNHVHFIALFQKGYTLSDMMRDFKKFTAKQIYRQYVAEENTKVLEILRQEGQKVKQEYKIWTDDFDARDVFSVPFLQQKMDYIHQNPCQPQWKLVKSPEQYLWSTAAFYLDGKPCIIQIDDVREILSI